MTADSAHEPHDGMAGLYALGGLNRSDREGFEQHLETCHECVQSVRSLLPVAHALSQAAPPQRPPAALRSRIMKLDAPLTLGTPELAAPTQLAPVYRVVAVACLIAAGALGWYAAHHVNAARQLRRDLAASTLQVQAAVSEAAASRRATAELRTRAEILAAPDVTTVELVGQSAAPNAAGRVFLSPGRGAVVTASNVPAPPPGHVYRAWFVIPPNPVSGGIVPVDEEGRMFGAIDPPSAVHRPIAVAVTLEPEIAASEPSGDIYLLGRTGQ